MSQKNKTKLVDQQWLSVTTNLGDDFMGLVIAERMPRVAYLYLCEADPILEMHGSMGKHFSATFNDVEHEVEKIDLEVDVMTWFSDGSLGLAPFSEWYTVLKKRGLSMPDIVRGFKHRDMRGSSIEAEEDSVMIVEAPGAVKPPLVESKKRPLSETRAAPVKESVAKKPRLDVKKSSSSSSAARVTQLMAVPDPWNTEDGNVYIFAFMWSDLKRSKRLYCFTIHEEDEQPFLAWAREAIDKLAPTDLYAVIRCFLGVKRVMDMLDESYGAAGMLYYYYDQLNMVMGNGCRYHSSRPVKFELESCFSLLCYYADDADDE